MRGGSPPEHGRAGHWGRGPQRPRKQRVDRVDSVVLDVAHKRVRRQDPHPSYKSDMGKRVQSSCSCATDQSR